MAYRPSKRTKRIIELEPPNLTPIMNLMLVLVPLLLSSAVWIRLGVIELNLPPAAAGPAGQALSQMPIESQKKLDLTVTITNNGFFISSSLAVLSGIEAGEPTIPKTSEASYDYEALSEKLYEIKQQAQGRFPDTDHIILLAEPDIDYQSLVSTMDASRIFRLVQENDTTWVPLFQDVSLSAGVF